MQLNGWLPKHIGLCFNNFKADKSIPMLSKVKRKLKIETEFNPSPLETLKIINKTYRQPNNLLIKFNDDRIDESKLLFENLHKRVNDNTKLIELNGNHLTPTNGAIENFLKDTTIEKKLLKNDNLGKLIDTIYNYCLKIDP